MTLKLIGKKVGMVRLFDKEGKQVVCTVISAEPNVVVQIKRQKTDGYSALQVGAFKQKSKRMTKPLLGHFAKAGVEPRKVLSEFQVEESDAHQEGQELDVNLFSDVEYVDVTGQSKGKGYQGVMKRHGFSGGPAAHGSSFHRHAGSTGMRSSPGRCLPGVKKAGRMGGERVTVHNLKVFSIDPARQALILEGAIPGARGCVVTVRKAMKKRQKRAKGQKG